ncbi:hypothetical protein GW7_20458 [Heterocephalus glaber]|uniref:Uncharacterized protein n=1 Tax=Heterocephalus glaber TaxID=10181 RepID=G5BKP6_HETGA|nr:hypothetical protein GW7_20458 [Heterocephalus glaber]
MPGVRRRARGPEEEGSMAAGAECADGDCPRQHVFLIPGKHGRRCLAAALGPGLRGRGAAGWDCVGADSTCGPALSCLGSLPRRSGVGSLRDCQTQILVTCPSPRRFPNPEAPKGTGSDPLGDRVR